MKRLLDATGISERTLRYWIRKKLAPKPIGRGRAARYTDEHLNRIRIVKHLRSTKLSLAKIRFVLTSQSDADLLATIPKVVPTFADGLPLPPPEPNYPFSSWQLIEVGPGLVIFVRANAGVMVRRVAQAMYEHYRMSPEYCVRQGQVA